jgi:hypothetical protein
VQQNVDRSLLVYAAYWRVAAEQLGSGSPGRYPAVPPINSVQWSAKNINVAKPGWPATCISLANAVMMVLEQAELPAKGQATGFKVDILGGFVDGDEVVTNLYNLNMGGDENRYKLSFMFCTALYDVALADVRRYLDLIEEMRGPRP